MRINPTTKFALIGIILGFTAGIICGALSATMTLILK
jgi:hypothetical protein